jgi:tripartite-type tricarboxylate transporter receptor subunit TctC
MLASRRSLALGAAVLAAPAAISSSWAQSWPQRPVRLIVPYAPGGGTDVFARALAEGLRPLLGQPVLVENRAGASGIVGSEVVARADPDGQVFLVDTGSHSLNPYVMPSLPYNTQRDFTPVALLSRFPMLLAAGATQPFKTAMELVEAAKAAPATIGFGTSDAAISYAGNLFARLAGIQMVEVSYRGAAPMLNDLIAGHLPTSWNSTVAALPHLQSGRIRALGVSTKERTALLPDVPTLAEAGIAGYEFAGWYGMLGPANLPAPIAARMGAAIEEALRDPGIRQRLLGIGADLRPLEPDEFRTFLGEEDAGWSRASREGLIVRAQ